MGALAVGFCLLGLAGCATAHKAPPSAPAAPSPVAAPAPSTATPAAPKALPPAVTPTPLLTAPPEAAPPVAGTTLLVESTPPGAVIVVDGRPVGKAPVWIAVPDTPQGFFRDYMEIRARFIAADPSGDSRTFMEEFTPREKVPAVLHFTPEGAQRTVR